MSVRNIDMILMVASDQLISFSLHFVLTFTYRTISIFKSSTRRKNVLQRTIYLKIFLNLLTPCNLVLKHGILKNLSLLHSDQLQNDNSIELKTL